MRLQTKEQREQVRQTRFTYLIKNGYTRQNYGSMVIFTKEDSGKYIIEAYEGTAANSFYNMYHRTAESAAAKVQEMKQSHDRRQQWKEEQREKNKGHKSSHAAAAAAIREELKKVFPGIKFSVRSDSFSMGNSIDIEWTDGPTTDEVEKFSGKYQYGHFNGMEDIYEYSNRREDIPQAKYVSEHRKMSEQVEALSAQLTDEAQTDTEYHNRPEMILYRIFNKTSLPAGAKVTGLIRTDSATAHGEGWAITYEATQEQPKQAAPEIAPGKIQVIEYSEKAIAVIGETFPVKDKLKEMGGKFNKYLKCGPGWIFSKSKFQEIADQLKSWKSEQPAETTTQQEQTGQPLPELNEEEKNAEAVKINEADILPTPENNTLNLDHFKIIWHEGRHIPGATFENTTLTTWEDVQRTFLILWQVNEKGSGGGYTKVKFEIKLQSQEPEICRIDITDKVNNGDFNPSFQHVSDYISELIGESEPAQNETMQALRY